ncbi:MAG: hypothetical protein ACI4JM_09250 [Oscillospiraceae bacterium]
MRKFIISLLAFAMVISVGCVEREENSTVSETTTIATETEETTTVSENKEYECEILNEEETLICLNVKLDIKNSEIQQIENLVDSYSNILNEYKDYNSIFIVWSLDEEEIAFVVCDKKNDDFMPKTISLSNDLGIIWENNNFRDYYDACFPEKVKNIERFQLNDFYCESLVNSETNEIKVTLNFENFNTSDDYKATFVELNKLKIMTSVTDICLKYENANKINFYWLENGLPIAYHEVLKDEYSFEQNLDNIIYLGEYAD